MPRRLVFETHATSLDNEAGLASGHHDVALSPAGERQAAEMGARYRGRPPALVLVSDLQRAWQTAEIAFGGLVPVRRDPRLRECDYGRLTRCPVGALEPLRLAAAFDPFPGGESYRDAAARVGVCLSELRDEWPGGFVLIVGHRATHYALDHLLGGLDLRDALRRPWKWQPGWKYDLR